MSDKSDAIMNASMQVFGDQVETRICFFHVLQAVQRWLKKTENAVAEGARTPCCNLARRSP
jgi:hypothetical protein